MLGRFRLHVFMFFNKHVIYLFFVCISLMADGPQRARLPIPPTVCNVAILHVVTKDLPISPRFSPYELLSSTLTTRQPIVEFYLLTFSLFPLLRKSEYIMEGLRAGWISHHGRGDAVLGVGRADST